MTREIIENKMKNAAITNVALKTSFSKPRLVNETDEALQVLPKPVPLVCMRMTEINAIEKMIWEINNKLCIPLLYSKKEILENSLN